MDSAMNDLFFAYTRLYGQAFSDKIMDTLKSAKEICEHTGDNFTATANEILNDLF